MVGSAGFVQERIPSWSGSEFPGSGIWPKYGADFRKLTGYGIRLRPSPLHEKFDFHQIYSVQIWCKKVRSKVKSRPEMVNTAFANEFTTPCKLVCQCLICHLCLRFPPRLHFFAPYLHWANLCKSDFSCSAREEGFAPIWARDAWSGK